MYVINCRNKHIYYYYLKSVKHISLSNYSVIHFMQKDGHLMFIYIHYTACCILHIFLPNELVHPHLEVRLLEPLSVEGTQVDADITQVTEIMYIRF